MFKIKFMYGPYSTNLILLLMLQNYIYRAIIVFRAKLQLKNRRTLYVGHSEERRK